MAQTNYVKLAILFLWIALILDATSVVLALIRLSFDIFRINIFGVLGVLFWWFLTAKAVSGKGWARLAYLLFTILEVLILMGITQTPVVAATILGHGDFGAFLAITKLILQGVGIAVLLAMQGSSR